MHWYGKEKLYLLCFCLWFQACTLSHCAVRNGRKWACVLQIFYVYICIINFKTKLENYLQVDDLRYFCCCCCCWILHTFISFLWVARRYTTMALAHNISLERKQIIVLKSHWDVCALFSTAHSDGIFSFFLGRCVVEWAREAKNMRLPSKKHICIFHNLFHSSSSSSMKLKHLLLLVNWYE